MATFAKSTFSASSYASFRPTYPPAFYTSLLAYHQGPKNTLLDLGTGHGLIPRKLSPHFDRLIGTDPSPSMIAQAQSSIKDLPEFSNVTFRQAHAEDLDFIEDGSLDVVTAGEAAHWFDYSKLWPEMQRVLRKGGTLALWAYKDNVFVGHPAATKIFHHYCYSQEEGLGGFWEQPGRSILRNLYRDIVPPENEWEVERTEYEPAIEGLKDSKGERLLWRKLTLGGMEGYVRTFSAYVNWAGAHPDRIPRAKGGQGDLVDEMFDKMLEAEPQWKSRGENWRDEEVEAEWATVILMARKK